MKTSHIFLLPALIFACVSCSESDKKSEDKTAEVVQTIDVAVPVTDTVTIHKSYPCYLSANMEVDLVARVDGYLLSAPYNAGDFVKKGTVLFNIESARYVDAVNQAAAALETAKATYDYASRNYEAMKKALESDAVSQMEVIQAKSNMETAKASIANAQASLSSAKTMLSYCTVRAPFDGHVSNSPYNPGAYLAGSGSPVTLGKIYEYDIVTVQFAIDDSELKKIVSNGNRELKEDLKHIPVNFGDTLPHSYTADLSYLAPAVNKSTGQINVQAHIKNTWGMTAVNPILKKEQDKSTIGLLICKDKDNVLAQYALESSSQPIGVAEFQLTKFVPDEFKSVLPSIDEIELELK